MAKETHISTKIQAENFIPIESKTPLHWASEKGLEKIVQMLLKRNVDIDSQDAKGFTPLMYATDKRHKGTVVLLLEAGANFDLQNKEEKTAISIAIGRQYYELIGLFIKKDKDDTSKPDAEEKGKEHVNQPAAKKLENVEGAMKGNKDEPSELEDEYYVQEFSSPMKEVVLLDQKKCQLEATGMHYDIPEKNVTVFIPSPEDEYDDNTITITFEDPPTKLGENENVESYTELIDLQPHGRSFDEYIVIRLPMIKQPTHPENVRLMYNASDDSDNPKWAVIPNNPNIYQKGSYLVMEENYYSIFTKHLCQFLPVETVETDKEDELTSITTALYGSYSAKENEITLSTLFSCSCHEHNYSKLKSEETLTEYGCLLRGPFNILIDKTGSCKRQPVRIEQEIEGQEGKWKPILVENEYPCISLGFNCNKETMLHEVRSVFGTPSNKTPFAATNILFTIKQFQTLDRKIRVKPLELVPRSRSSSRQSFQTDDFEMKRPCLCNMPACVKRRGQESDDLLDQQRIAMFSCKYLKHDYDIFYHVLQENKQKFYTLVQQYYNSRTEKNNLPSKYTVFEYFRREAAKVRGWSLLWKHLKDLAWKEAVDAFEYVYERNRLLQACETLAKFLVVSDMKTDLLKEKLISKEGKSYIENKSVLNADKVNYVIKHVLLEDWPYEEIGTGLNKLRSFNKIMMDKYPQFIKPIISWLEK